MRTQTKSGNDSSGIICCHCWLGDCDAFGTCKFQRFSLLFWWAEVWNWTFCYQLWWRGIKSEPRILTRTPTVNKWKIVKWNKNQRCKAFVITDAHYIKWFMGREVGWGIGSKWHEKVPILWQDHPRVLQWARIYFKIDSRKSNYSSLRPSSEMCFIKFNLFHVLLNRTPPK